MKENIINISFPLLVTNFKTYENATGAKALELARIHEKVSKEENVSIACAVQTTDIYRIAKEVMIPIFAQHFDLHAQGANTGAVMPEALKMAGAQGSLLNHSEYRVPFSDLAESLNRASYCGLFVVLCAHDHEEAEKFAGFHPDAIAVEPPELIGGDVSISSARPDVIKRAVEGIKNVPVLVGAGVKKEEDVSKAVFLGAKGILLASGITKAKDPEAVIRSLVRAFKKSP